MSNHKEPEVADRECAAIRSGGGLLILVLLATGFICTCALPFCDTWLDAKTPYAFAHRIK
jgi:hypothetical protein